MPLKTVLHVGPGHPKSGAKLPSGFQAQTWQEIRLDIDPANQPDIIGSMQDMHAVADESMNAVYSAHNIEHVHAFEVPQVLKEFLRVLKPEGFLVITCPDLQAVCTLVVQDKLTDPCVSLTRRSDHALGHPLRPRTSPGCRCHHYMAHKCGFTLRSLTLALQEAGFQTMAGKRRLHAFSLWMIACKSVVDEAEIRRLAGELLPD
ncbi:Methyltransferase domain-containing protein [Desulfonatronum zhilinae]|nr:Methyltransferase domain-containing protein [Desulfonatronum zhilinae]